MKAKKLCIALLSALLLTCVSLTAFSLQSLNKAQADTVSGTPTFTVIGGVGGNAPANNYTNICDGDTGTKYCVAITNNPYVTFRASDVGTIVTGYMLYTGNDTKPDHTGRNPKAWKLQGSNDGANWTDIHTVDNDEELPKVENKEAASYTFENATPYWYYKITFTARHGESSDDGNLMQLSEIEFKARITDAVEIATAEDLASAFANGGKVKLTADIALTSDLSLNQKTLELDLNGHVISRQKLSVMGASSVSHSILILKDSDPSATHADTSLPAGGVISSELSLTRNSSDETWANKAYLYANGGTVVQQLKIDTGSSQIDYYGDTMTTFNAGVHGAGATINAGFYYGSVISTNEEKPYTTSNKKVEFKIGDDVYATQYLRSGDKAICPTEPTVDGYTFIKWYNSATNSYHDFASAVTSDLTIKAMLMKEVGTFDDLKSEIYGGNSVKLTADIMTDNFSISSGKNITIDLNGYVIYGNGKQIYGTGCGANTNPGPSTKLTIIDSNPNATHTDASLPVGGYINAKISITATSNYSGDTGEFYLYVNGGTIREVYSNSFAGYVIWSDGAAPSVIEKISGSATVRGGLYYYEQSISDYNDGTVRKVTYKDGDNVYAVLGMNGNTATKKAVEPKEPAKKSGCVFDGWYNGDTKYDFSTPVTANLTLTAHWVEDNTAPGITGVVDNGVYCENKEVTVTDENLDTVTVDGVEVTLTDGKFTLDMSLGTVKVIVATDKALNSTTVNVKFGHTFGEWTNAVTPDCTKDGNYKYRQCSVCNQYEYIDGDDVTKTCLSTEFDTKIKLAATGHDWTLTFCEEAAQKGEGNFHDYYCSTCHEWKGERKECNISDDWQRDDNNHWRICEDCGHRHFLDEHDQAIVCDSQKHWSECPVCEKEFGVHTAHVFENEQSTTCSTEGCTYQRYSAIEIEVENYVVDGLMTEFDAVAHNKTNNVDMSLVRAYFFDENVQLIEIWRDEGGLDFGATFQPETLYFVEFVFRCDNYFFDTKASIENIKLPAGYSVVELGHDTWSDGPETPRYNVCYIIAVMPQIGGVSQLEKVPDLQIEIGNFAAGGKVGDVTFAANADAEIVYREVGRSGLVLPDTTVIDNKGFYTIKLAVSAPVGYTFRGYTVNDVTVKNGLGEVISAEVSDNGSLLFVVIETRSGIEEHDCSANRDYLAADKDSITNADPEHKHRTVCAICGDYIYENHVYDDDLDANCNLCGYKRYVKPDRLDIIVENYVLDGLVDKITIKIAENDYEISVVGTFNNDYHVLDAQGNYYFGDHSRFLPDEQYTIRFDVVANSIISFANVTEGNVYINGQLAEIKYAYVYTNTTQILYELKLPKLTGTTAQKKATGIGFSASGVSLGGNMSNVVLTATAENAAVKALRIYYYRVNGSQKEQVSADVGKFTEGYQYYIKLNIKLNEWYYAKGMGEGDVTLGNFPLVGEITYKDDVLGGGISPGADTIVIYTFKVLFDQGEEHVHKFTGENLKYDVNTKGHAVICDCGVLGERVAHVPSEENESLCSVCGGAIVEVLEKVEFTCSNYQVGTFIQLPALNSVSSLVTIDTAVFSDEYDFETLAINSNSMIIMPNIRYALVVICSTTSDVSDLTKQDYVLKGVGESDITASFLRLNAYSSEYEMFIGFVLPELGGATAHIHGGTWIDEVPANCTASGTKGHYVCTICGDNFDADNKKLEDLTINALGHTWSTSEIIDEEPAKCTETGTKAHWHCETCNKDFESDKTTEIADLTIAAKGHNFGEWIEEVPATANTDGEKGHKDCSVCGKHFDKDGVELESLVIEKLPESGLSGGAIAGIAVGGTAVLGCGGFSIFWFLIKKKKFSDLF